MKQTLRYVISIVWCVSIALLQYGYGQDNFQTGYLLAQSGDTIRGYINDLNWRKSPVGIEFRPTLEAQSELLDPTKIGGFSVGGEIYTSAIVEKEESSENLANLEYDADLNIRIDTVFLQLLVQGKLSLYYHQDEIDLKNYYMRTANDQWTLLGHKKYYQLKEGKTILAENRQYLGQLRNQMQDCSTMIGSLNETTYTQKSLTDLFLQYLECVGADIGYYHKPAKIRLQAGIFAGITATSFQFKGGAGSSLSSLELIDFPISTGLSGGAYLEIVFPRNREKLSLVNELYYNAFQTTGTVVESESVDRFLTTTAEVEYTYLKLAHLVRYKLLVGNSSVYITGGIANGFAISSDSYHLRERVTGPLTTLIENRPIADFRTYEQSAIVGVGLMVGPAIIDLRYETGNGISQIPNFGSPTDRVSAFVGYRLWK